MSKITSIQLFKNIKALVEQRKQELYAVINVTLTETYFHIGRLIVDYEQQGSKRAVYAKETLINLSQKLTPVLGKGFSVDNLENMRKFYLVYKDDYLKYISKNKKSEPLARKLALSPFKLSWTHYVMLLKIENAIERKFYEIEASSENWSKRELKRQFESALFERLALSRDKNKVKELGKKGHIIANPADAIKEDYILEFLGYDEKDFYSENDLEKAIINKLEHFLLELGKGFLFVERQKRIKMDGDDYKVDLVFYNRILRCFVLIDLKIGTLQHKDIGQMQMYVNYFDEELKAAEESKTIGIILCKSKKESTIKYTLGKDNKQIFASKYKMYFPEKQILKLLQDQKI
jgi:predicted nuclease of restriction endonuclease-like (RecB) superfamily